MAGNALPPVVLELRAVAGEMIAKVGEARESVRRTAEEIEADAKRIEVEIDATLAKEAEAARASGRDFDEAGRRAELSAQKMADTSKKAGGHLQGLANVGKMALSTLGVGFVAAAGMSLKAGMEYQSTLATIRGAAQLTAPQVKGIGDAFVNTMGKSTFSAQQMAGAFAPVAGVVKQLSGGTLTAASSMQFMQAAMDASEATGVSLNSTTADLSSVMLAFGLNTKQAGSASNMLFNISRNTGISLDQLSQTVVMLHGRLGITAPSLADTGALMVDLARHGVSGSRGVRVVQSALTTLIGGSKATNTELKTLGVNVFNASGHFVGMSSVIGQLQPVLAHMTDQQRTAAEAVLFGKSAAQAMNDTVMSGVGAYNKSAAAVGQQNAVQKAAAEQARTLHGEVHTLAATVEDLATKFGTMLIPVITRAVGVIIPMVTWLQKHKAVAIALGAVIAGVLVVAIGAYVVSMAAAAVATIAAMAPMLLIVGAVGLIIAAVVELVLHWRSVWAEVKQIASDAWHFLDGVWHSIDHTIRSVWGKIESFFKQWWPVLLGIFTGGIGLVVVLLIQHWHRIQQDIAGVWHAIETFFTGTLGRIFGEVVGWVGKFLGKIIDFGGRLFTDVGTAMAGFLTAVVNGGVKIMGWFTALPRKIIGWLGNLGNLLVSAGGDIIGGLVKGIEGAVGKAVSAVKHVARSIVNGVKSFFGISSPSKVFAEIGGQLAAGLVAGMQGGHGAVTSAARALAASGMPGGGAAGVGAFGASTGIAPLAGVGGSTSTGGARPGGGVLQIVHAPNITVVGGGRLSPEAEAQTRRLLAEDRDEFVRTLVARGAA